MQEAFERWTLIIYFFINVIHHCFKIYNVLFFAIRHFDSNVQQLESQKILWIRKPRQNKKYDVKPRNIYTVSVFSGRLHAKRVLNVCLQNFTVHLCFQERKVERSHVQNMMQYVLCAAEKFIF